MGSIGKAVKTHTLEICMAGLMNLNRRNPFLMGQDLFKKLFLSHNELDNSEGDNWNCLPKTSLDLKPFRVIENLSCEIFLKGNQSEYYDLIGRTWNSSKANSSILTLS